jgi:hypothetical protein
VTSADEPELRRLEESLWRPETRFDREHLDRVLAPGFVEFGRSGRIWSRDEVLDAPPWPFRVRLPVPGFTVTFPAPDVALVTYRSEMLEPEIVRANRTR